MKKSYMKLLRTVFCLALLFVGVPSFAQDRPEDEAKEEKDLATYIDTQVERLENQLELEYWQVFLIDSVLTHDYNALQQEFKRFRKEKIGNSDEYYKAQDKWNDAMYYGIMKVLNDEQKAKFDKSAMGKAKKQRDKKKAKSAGL